MFDISRLREMERMVIIPVNRSLKKGNTDKFNGLDTLIRSSSTNIQAVAKMSKAIKKFDKSGKYYNNLTAQITPQFTQNTVIQAYKITKY